ncbi:SGNH/GDSL hydrolase family protein [Enterobacter ludwigii]|uniref:SGNH/GDSL hydrolase family protein n=1 Tax=Enterobacter ludwigii TaxID=299767 RepID=UPI001BAC627D|nr:SGNH/GDSL hydrolase family protein [Enterobacter ludwigii]MBS0870536.1 SGNH/GDSL hydrolase family protein [Enterobacter ludwigii]
MAITNETVSWTNAASAGTDWQGIEVACSAGAEFDVQVRNMSATGSGEVLIGARMLANYGASGSVFNYRFVIGTDGFKFFNGNTEVTSGSYNTWHPEDQIQAANGSVRLGIRIGTDLKSVQLILNGRPYPLVAGNNAARSIVVMANQAARASTQLQYAHIRSRDMVPYAHGVKICTLGNSITRGARSSNEWPSLLGNCGEHMPGVGKLSIDNSMSVIGKRMVKVAEEITADPSSYNFVGFDYVLVALGVNAFQATGESGIGLFSSAIDTIENKIKADKAVPIFATPYRYLTLSQTGNGNETTNQKDLPFFQQTLRERCAANGYALAEVADAMGDSAGSPGGFDSTGFMNAWTTDNIHANTRGQLAIASAFFSALSRLAASASPGCLCQILLPTGTFTTQNETVAGLLRVTRRWNTIHIIGSVSAGASGAVITNLPAWARPAQSVYSLAYTRDASTESYCQLEIRQSGDIVFGGLYKTGRTDINISFEI